MRLATALACVGLAGCGQGGAPPPDPVATATATQTPTTATTSASSEPTAAAAAQATPETLIGEWRVAGMDGRPVDGPVGLTLSINAKTIGFEPRCAGFNWHYSYADGALELARPPGPPPPRGTAPPPICAVAVAPEQRDLARALDAVTQARKTASNGVELSGGGRSVTIYRQ